MAEKVNAPEIRFKGCSGKWEQQKLGILVDVIDGDRGCNYPNGGELQKTGHTLFLSASNVTKNGFKLGNSQYITEKKSNSLGNGKLVRDDVVLTSRGSVGHIAWYNENITQKVPFARINSGMLILRSKDVVQPCFIAHYLKSPLGKNKINFISFGSAQPQLTKNSVSGYTLALPKDGGEQTKIGNYFQQLDTLITHHQQKHDKLLNVKKAMLEKMFPKQGADVPEIRFKGFSGGWEEQSFKDIVFKLSGGAAIKPDDYQDEGKRTIPKGAVNSTGIADLSGSKYISKAFFASNILSKAASGDLVTSLRDLVPSAPNMGRIVRIKCSQEDFLMPQGVYRVQFNEDIDENFVIAYSNSDLYRKIISREKSGSTQVHIRNGDFLGIEIFKPDFKEQIKVGNYFKVLDTNITLHQTQLDKLKNIKKACLEKMFV